MKYLNKKMFVFMVMTFVIFTAYAATSHAQNIEKILAKQEILATIYQYSYNFDGKNPDKFAELFTEDAVWEVFPLGAEKPQISFTNRSDLKDFVSNRFKTVLANRQTRHYLTNTVFLELTNNFARTRSTVLVVHTIKGEKQPQVMISAMFKDEFTKTEDGWKFSHHIAAME